MISNLRRVSVIVAVIISVWAASVLLVMCLFPDWATRGQFGDSFGSINALFSGLAFAGVIYTILLQREELGLQRKELELTRTELSRAASAQELSEKALNAQVELIRDAGRMAAADSLLRHYRAELSRHRGVSYPNDDPRSCSVSELEAREQMLLAMMDGIFSEMSRYKSER